MCACVCGLRGGVLCELCSVSHPLGSLSGEVRGLSTESRLLTYIIGKRAASQLHLTDLTSNPRPDSVSLPIPLGSPTPVGDGRRHKGKPVPGKLEV